jgi:hypothetical protein
MTQQITGGSTAMTNATNGQARPAATAPTTDLLVGRAVKGGMVVGEGVLLTNAEALMMHNNVVDHRRHELWLEGRVAQLEKRLYDAERNAADVLDRAHKVLDQAEAMADRPERPR